MDRELRKEIRADVQQAISSAMAEIQEQWLTGEELCKQFSMITPKLLKYHGDIFPRKRITMVGINGISHSTRWAYPRYQIASNIASGMYDELRIMKNL